MSTTRLDAGDLEGLERIVDAMTPDPWNADLDVFDMEDEGIVACVTSAEGLFFNIATDLTMKHEEWTRDAADAQWEQAKAGQEIRDAKGICALRNSAPALIAMARRSLELEAALREALHAADILAEAGNNRGLDKVLARLRSLLGGENRE